MVVEVRIVVISVRALTGMGHEGSFRMLEMIYILIWWVIQSKHIKIHHTLHFTHFTIQISNLLQKEKSLSSAHDNGEDQVTPAMLVKHQTHLHDYCSVIIMCWEGVTV